MYDITDRKEVEENISDCLRYLKIAFQGLFRRHEYGRAELVLNAIDELKDVLSDVQEPEHVWETMDIATEIDGCLSRASNLLAKARKPHPDGMRLFQQNRPGQKIGPSFKKFSSSAALLFSSFLLQTKNGNLFPGNSKDFKS